MGPSHRQTGEDERSEDTGDRAAGWYERGKQPYDEASYGSGSILRYQIRGQAAKGGEAPSLPAKVDKSTTDGRGNGPTWETANQKRIGILRVDVFERLEIKVVVDNGDIWDRNVLLSSIFDGGKRQNDGQGVGDQ
jgi:hypothetical protein